MRVHHLNCATLCLPLGPWVTGNKEGPYAGKLVCHCLLIETEDGLVLVDAGLGLEDIAHVRQRLGRLTNFLLGPRLARAETAFEQVKALGFKPEDVRHILVTHLDLDHIGGISDFPHATLHLYGAQERVAGGNVSRKERRRYKPIQWAYGPRIQKAELGGQSFMGFEAVRDLKGLPPEVLIVPLSGHTEGHCGIAIESERGWLLHAGDAYYHRCAMERPQGRSPLFARLLDRFNTWDKEKLLANRSRLRELVHSTEQDVTVFCSHDPAEYQACRDSYRSRR